MNPSKHYGPEPSILNDKVFLHLLNYTFYHMTSNIILKQHSQIYVVSRLQLIRFRPCKKCTILMHNKDIFRSMLCLVCWPSQMFTYIYLYSTNKSHVTKGAFIGGYWVIITKSAIFSF